MPGTKLYLREKVTVAKPGAKRDSIVLGPEDNPVTIEDKDVAERLVRLGAASEKAPPKGDADADDAGDE